MKKLNIDMLSFFSYQITQNQPITRRNKDHIPFRHGKKQIVVLAILKYCYIIRQPMKELKINIQP